MCEFSEADTANAELSQICMRSATNFADKEFAHVTYNDYTVKATEDAVVTENDVAVITDEKQLNVEFDMKITLKGHTIYKAEDEKEAK